MPDEEDILVVSCDRSLFCRASPREIFVAPLAGTDDDEDEDIFVVAP